MDVIFLDIDGVLNNCMSSGVFHESSTIRSCVMELNRIIFSSGAGIVLISTWKDSYDFQIIRNLLYERRVCDGSILDFTEIGVNKEDGIIKFLNNARFKVDKFIIIDDNLDLKNNYLRINYIKTESIIGLTQKEADFAIEKFDTMEVGIDKVKWDKLIEDHYLSACKRNPEYKKKHTKEEMIEYWYSLLNNPAVINEDVENMIKGTTHANNNNTTYHPV